MKEESQSFWEVEDQPQVRVLRRQKKKKKNSARDQSNTGITSIKSSRHLSILTP